MASCTGEEDISDDSRTAVSCSSSTISKPFPSLTNSSARQNIISSDTQAIQSSITDAGGEVTCCNDEVSPPRVIIDGLEKPQSELVHEISIQESSLAPIHCLPLELLALIFSFFCTVDFWDCERFSTTKDRISGSIFREPFVIATVCSHWRSIAVSTPSLWSTIMLGGQDINLSREDYEADKDLEVDESVTFPDEILEVALERSAQHPVKLWTERFDYEYWPSIFTHKLRQICGRITELYLAGNSDPFCVSDSPNLEFNQLVAVHVCPDYELNSMDPLPWLSTATNVRLLILQELHKANAEFWTHLPLESAQSLLLETISISEATILSKFPNISSAALRCEFSDKDSPFFWKSAPTFHHFSAIISCSERDSCHCLSDLLSALTLPGLKSLQLQGDSFYSGACWSNTGFSDFLERSAIKEGLTWLSLHEIDGLDEDELVKVFQSVPSLTRFTASAFGEKPIISTEMLERLAKVPLLPRLKLFEVQIDETVDAIDAISHLVSARTSPQGDLKEIIVFVTQLSETVEQRLKNGMENFTSTRHSILNARSWWDYLSFERWIQEIQKVEQLSL
ncbi:hypothetical protein C8J56DRAFT_1051342 [Mycena floridula]|nr:hypothetical protein C8J56DRAFT_1051342 [Mycena floridula]